MSPLGTLETQSKKSSRYHHHHLNHRYLNSQPMFYPSNIPGGNAVNGGGAAAASVINEHLLKLMSVSLVNDLGPVALNLTPGKPLPHSFLHHHHNLHPHPLLVSPNSSSSPVEMLLKSGHLPGGSPVPIPSPSSGSGHPESPKSTADTSLTPPPYSLTPTTISAPTTLANDDDEVLSIGRDDDQQQMLADADCDLSEDDGEEGYHKNNFNTGPTTLNASRKAQISKSPVLTMTKNSIRSNSELTKDYTNHTGSYRDETSSNCNLSQGSCSDDDDRLSQNSSECHTPSTIININNKRCSSNNSLTRNRKYSSEDSFTIKSLCSPTTPPSSNYHHNTNSNDTTTSTASPPPLPNHLNLLNGSSNNSPTNSASRHSLLFSIANILRPDFGLATNSNPFAHMKALSSPPILDFNYNSPQSKKSSSHHGGHQSRQGSHQSHHHHHRHHSSGSGAKSKGSLGRIESLSINPIDLSRPGSTGSHHPQQISSRPPHHPSANNSSKISSNNNNNHSTGNNNIRSNGGGVVSKKIKLDKESLPSLSPSSAKDDKTSNSSSNNKSSDGQTLWPAWVYCTRYSDRPSSGPRARRTRKSKEKEVDEKRPRTAFTAEQLARLKKEFEENRYLTEKRRQDLANELRLHENQIKIWFQNKRAKLKKASGQRGGLALQLMAQGLYNHSTIPKSGLEDDDDDSD